MPVALRTVEHGERLVQFVISDLVLVDVELLEDGLVQQTPLFIVASPVELLRVLEQRQAQLDQASGDGKLLIGLVEAS